MKRKMKRTQNMKEKLLIAALGAAMAFTCLPAKNIRAAAEEIPSPTAEAVQTEDAVSGSEVKPTEKTVEQSTPAPAKKAAPAEPSAAPTPTAEPTATPTPTAEPTPEDENPYISPDPLPENYTGLAEGKDGCVYYLENGKQSNITNLIKDEKNNRWIYIVNGKADMKTTTLASVSGSNVYYYVKNSVIDRSFTDLYSYCGYWYYVKNGKVDYSFKGIVRHGSHWYCVENGVWNRKFTDLFLQGGTWYYIKNGVWDSGANTLAQLHGKGTWYYIKDGKIDRTFTGLFKFGSTQYYIQKGRLDKNFSNLVLVGRTWYYIDHGAVRNTTDLVKYGQTWYYVKNGRIDWNQTTLARLNGKGTWYYVKNARIAWNYSGLVNYNSKWYYVRNGKVDWNYTNLVHNGSWYYVRNGMIDRNYRGLVQLNGRGTWYYIRDGRIDFSYNGKAQIGGKGTWHQVKDGRYNPPKITDGNDAKTQNYSSSSGYLLLVNRSAHRVYIYRGKKGNWSRYKTFICTNGKASTPTIGGVFRIGNRGRYFDTGSSGRCWYFTQIHGGYLFHSVIYDRSGSPRRVIDGRLGIAASHGCVRLAIGNAKWIHDTIPGGSTVVIY